MNKLEESKMWWHPTSHSDMEGRTRESSVGFLFHYNCWVLASHGSVVLAFNMTKFLEDLSEWLFGLMFTHHVIFYSNSHSDWPSYPNTPYLMDFCSKLHVYSWLLFPCFLRLIGNMQMHVLPKWIGIENVNVLYLHIKWIYVHLNSDVCFLAVIKWNAL